MTCPDDTPLHSAIRSFKGDENLIRILLENDDSDINECNSEGETPLLLAVQNQRCSYGLIELLLQYGADVKATLPRDGNTALHLVSIKLKYSNDMKWPFIGSKLLKNGSDANAKNLQGCIPLHLAAEAETLHALDLTIRLGHLSDPNARNSKDDSPLHLYMRNEKICNFYKKVFLENAGKLNVLVNVVNSKGETPLHLAVRSKHCDFALIKKFLYLGADVSMTDATGENAYQAFCRAIEDEDNKYGQQDILMSQTILQGNLKQQISSSLHVACLFHNVDSVHNLLRMGADVNAVHPFDRAPLYYASIVKSDEDFENQISTLQLMLDYGADVNQGHDPLLPDDYFSSYHCTFLEMAVLFNRSWNRRPINDNNLYFNKCNIFVQHAAKLLALQEKHVERGIDVQLLNERNRRFLMEDPFHRAEKSGYKDWLSCCSEELQVMSETKISDSELSFFDLLVASAKKATMYAKNKELVKAFYAKKAMFPMYQGMLDAKLARDLERRKLIESAAVSMCNALEFADPSDEFYERTLSYCSNEDLINVTDGLGEMELY